MTRIRMTAIVAAVALTLAACGDDNDGSTAAKDARPAAKVSNEWALQYTGGTAGKADPDKTPITIGYINQEDSVPSFPEATAGLNAAVEYVNAELGGADGHPVVIKKCVVRSEEDGQKCATEMANDSKVQFIILGVTAVGQKSIYSVVAGKKPIISASPSTIDDLTAKNAYAYTSGGPGIIAGMAIFTAKYLKGIDKVGVIHGDNPAAKQSAEQFLKPLLLQLGVKDVKLVAVADNATSPDVASAIQAAGGDQIDALVAFVTVPACIATYDGLQSLGISPTVVATGLCFGTPMTKHLKDIGSSDEVPDGWYFAAYGYSYFIPDEASGMKTYLAKIKQYAGTDVEYTGFAGFLFADLLTSVKFINEIGADQLSSAAIAQKMKDFKGPMMITSGPMECGYSKMFAALCGQQVGIEQYKGGKWLPTALATNGGKAIDVSKVLGG
ncbi:MAG: ABC transporter substrate-binding protein [Thermoleophilaceae bacterium]